MTGSAWHRKIEETLAFCISRSVIVEYAIDVERDKKALEILASLTRTAGRNTVETVWHTISGEAE